MAESRQAEGHFREGVAYLADLTEASVEASRVRSGEAVGTRPSNQLGMTVIRPGGRNCYPAVWTQDFCMTLASGFVTDEEALDHFRLIARGQNGPEEHLLGSGAVVPPFAIPDHLTFDGRPIYFPGTYSSGEDQGGEPWGLRPPVNNHYDFIAIAHHLRGRLGRVAFLREVIGGLALWERLKLAFLVPEIDPDTGLVHIDAARRAVGFIFCDSVYMTGHHLFSSLLRRRAALQMAEMAAQIGESSAPWHDEARLIEAHLPGPFAEEARIGGWLMAATDVGRQPDVWGTIYALVQRALPPATAEAARKEVVRAIEDGTILFRGALRHVPTNHDARPDSAWERALAGHNHYQNGAYWHTPTGWLVAALWETHRALALRVFDDMIASLREEDFRQGPTFNAPWECFGPDAEAAKNPLFLASVTTPFGVVKNLDSETP